MSLPGIGAKRALALADHFITWDRLASAAAWEHRQVVGAVAKNLTPEALAVPPPLPDLPEGVRLLSMFDNEWHPGLHGIPDPPALLWVKGAPAPARMLAIVGTRTPTLYGETVARMTATGAAEQGISIVSGLALGIDSLAHRTCMEAGQPTWAIIGQGLATLNEGERADLSRDILAAGGGLIAEVPPGEPSAPHHLVRRNRLQSAMSLAVVIAQSGLPGRGKPAGTMHTARYAVTQGRPLVAGRPTGAWATETESAGNLALTDPAGCPPEAVHASDKTDIIRCMDRLPYADLTLHTRTDLPALWDLIGVTNKPSTDPFR